MEEKNTSKSHKKLKNKIVTIIVGIIILVIIVLWFGIGNFFTNNENVSFTNPILNTKQGESIMQNKNINLEYYLQAYEKEKIMNEDIIHLSVYFRQMNNGNWFGINEKAMFSPASLMKLPLLLAYFKKSESEPGFLEKKIVFTKNGTSDLYRQNVLPENRLKEGNEYKLIEMLEHMIKHSDNDVSILLEKNISINEFKKVFSDVGIEFPPFVDGSFDDNIRVIDYSVFFRVLFNSSYLNKQNSEKVLKLLTKTKFKDGLVAGVSDVNLAVSHKFGERSIWGANGIERMQLHDCGIVYYPERPYLLCMMTKGYDWNKLKGILQEVSNMVYQAVDEAYSK